jgi:hypothetical protein
VAAGGQQGKPWPEVTAIIEPEHHHVIEPMLYATPPAWAHYLPGYDTMQAFLDGATPAAEYPAGYPACLPLAPWGW